MKDFIITLIDGKRYTVQADRVLQDHQCVTLWLDPPLGGDDAQTDRGRLASVGATVALFDRSLVAMVIARENLVSEEAGTPTPTPPHVVPSGEEPEPF